MYYITNVKPGRGLACSNVTEHAVEKFLDSEGVPAEVPKYKRPSDAPPAKGPGCYEPDRPDFDRKPEPEYLGAHFTF